MADSELPPNIREFNEMFGCRSSTPGFMNRGYDVRY
jgi:hypothetical protein